MARHSCSASCPVVGSLSEGEILARMVPLLPRGVRTVVPSGDDCAVIALQAAGSGQGRDAQEAHLAVSTDMLVEDVHFRREWSDGFDVGFRCAMQNLADAVAMGAAPRSLVIAMCFPADLPLCWLEDFARGLAAACPPGVGVDGGDLTTGEKIVISVTVLADMCGREPILRSGARVGDGIYHCGNLGAGALGLALLSAGARPDLSGIDVSNVSDEVRELWYEAIGFFLRPQPPLNILPTLDSVSAMMDVSDGLARDASRIARASSVTLDISIQALVSHPAAERLRPGFEAACARGIITDTNFIGFLLAAGEDHGFLATSPHAIPGWHRIGEVWECSQAAGLFAVDGEPWKGALGWDHFKAKP